MNEKINNLIIYFKISKQLIKINNFKNVFIVVFIRFIYIAINKNINEFYKIFELKGFEKNLFKIFDFDDTIMFIKFKKKFII